MDTAKRLFIIALQHICISSFATQNCKQML